LVNGGIRWRAREIPFLNVPPRGGAIHKTRVSLHGDFRDAGQGMAVGERALRAADERAGKEREACGRVSAETGKRDNGTGSI
jgi:hypothetical protein